MACGYTLVYTVVYIPEAGLWETIDRVGIGFQTDIMNKQHRHTILLDCVYSINSIIASPHPIIEVQVKYTPLTIAINCGVRR